MNSTNTPIILAITLGLLYVAYQRSRTEGYATSGLAYPAFYAEQMAYVYNKPCADEKEREASSAKIVADVRAGNNYDVVGQAP